MRENTARAVLPAFGEESETRREPNLQVCSLRGSVLIPHLQKLREQSVRLRYHRNEIVCAEGEAVKQINYVASGCIRLCSHLADGRRHIADFIFAGDVFGAGEFTHFPYSAEAVDAVSVVAYPASAFRALAEQDRKLDADLMVHFSALLAEAQKRLFRATCQDALERTASFIIQVSGHAELVCGDRLDLPMGRQEIADHLGLTIETICRVLARMRAAGTIDMPSTHQLIVRRPDELRAIAEGRKPQ